MTIQNSNPVASLAIYSVTIYVTVLERKHHFASYFSAKHQKHNKLWVTNLREKPVDFGCY